MIEKASYFNSMYVWYYGLIIVISSILYLHGELYMICHSNETLPFSTKVYLNLLKESTYRYSRLIYGTFNNIIFN